MVKCCPMVGMRSVQLVGFRLRTDLFQVGFATNEARCL